MNTWNGTLFDWIWGMKQRVKAMTIELGDEVRDTVSGFCGVVTAKNFYLNGCIRVCVTPQKCKEDGTYPVGEYLDVGQLEVVTKQKIKPQVRVDEPQDEVGAERPKRTGGPQRDEHKSAIAAPR